MIEINIQNKNFCCGCEACEQICPCNCIIMKRDYEGFLYPEVNVDRCIDCGLCNSVCSIENLKSKENKIKQKVYAGYNLDDEIRKMSTSGGIFSVLANKIISENGVVFGVGFDKNLNVNHQIAKTLSELDNFKGSKYVQSSINGSFIKLKHELDKKKKVLFSGTPCQIEGLGLFLGKEYENLITCGIVCHGVPSPKVFDAYRDFLETKYASNISKIYFREKVNGWKNSNFTAKFENGKEYSIKLGKDPYTNAFLCDLYLRPVCHNCKYKNNADIMLGDFWGIHTRKPYLDDDKGTSLVIINSKKGEEYFNSIKEKIKFEEAEFSHALERNPNLIGSSKKHPKREVFFEDFNELKFEKVMRKYMNPLISTFKNRLIRKIKKIIIIK